MRKTPDRFASFWSGGVLYQGGVACEVLTMKTETVFSGNTFRAVTDEELQAVSGGWCGNDPKYWGIGPRPPADPFRGLLGPMNPATQFEMGATVGF